MYAIPNQSTTGIQWASAILILTPLSVGLSVYLFNTIGFGWLACWIGLNCWLFTGLFITAHDCMHNSIFPNQPQKNKWLGQLALLSYAGLVYEKLLEGHIRHHKDTATDKDPDYLAHTAKPTPLLAIRWYGSFLQSYLTWHPFLWMSFWFTLFDRGLNISTDAMLCCWILPQVLSTIQLFYFGTYLPHRGHFEAGTFPARSNNYPTWLSFLTCFHFGYHAEHHAHPYVPWWYLSKIRTLEKAS